MKGEQAMRWNIPHNISVPYSRETRERLRKRNVQAEIKDKAKVFIEELAKEFDDRSVAYGISDAVEEFRKRVGDI